MNVMFPPRLLVNMPYCGEPLRPRGSVPMARISNSVSGRQCYLIMNGVLGHLCAHIGKTGPGKPPEGGEMSEMALPSQHTIRKSNPGGLNPSSLLLTEALHNIESLRVSREKTFRFLKFECQSGVRSRDFRLSKQAALTTAPEPRPSVI